MANILIVEQDLVAVRAIKGILARGGHRIAFTTSIKSSWKFLERNVIVDIIFMDLKFGTDKGWDLIAKIRASPIMNGIPIVVYTSIIDKTIIHKVLTLGVQNYLLKPYAPEKIFEEINKARRKDWIDNICPSRSQQNQVSCVNALKHKAVIKQIQVLISKNRNTINGLTFNPNLEPVENFIKELKKLSEMIICSMVLKLIKPIQDAIKEEDLKAVETTAEPLFFIPPLIEHQLNNRYIPPGFNGFKEDTPISYQEKGKTINAWQGKSVGNSSPYLSRKEIIDSITRMSSFPIIDSVVASYQMALRGIEIDIPVIYDLVEHDGNLACQILRYASLSREERLHGFEDPLMIIQFLGSKNLRSVVSNVQKVRDELIGHEKFTWTGFWMHQMGTAVLAREIIEQMEVEGQNMRAFWAGIVHDIGKSILCFLYPLGYKTALNYSAKTKIPLFDVEQRIFRLNHEEAGVTLMRASNMPTLFENAVLHHSNPEGCPEIDKPAIAAVSLANFICTRYNIGYSGNNTIFNYSELRSQPGYKVLREYSYPGFNWIFLERYLERKTTHLRSELIGKASRIGKPTIKI